MTSVEIVKALREECKTCCEISVVCRKCGTKYQFKAGFKENPYEEAVEAWNRRGNDG